MNDGRRVATAIERTLYAIWSPMKKRSSVDPGFTGYLKRPALTNDNEIRTREARRRKRSVKAPDRRRTRWPYQTLFALGYMVLAAYTLTVWRFYF